MLADPEPTVASSDGATVRHAPAPPRRSRRWRPVLVSLATALALVVVLVGRTVQTTPSQAPPVAPPAPLIAHGQILPARQARVGTQTGGAVQRLEATPGTAVVAQAALAWVLGPGGLEVVTAPFAGTVSNVLVHAGDTLAPGTTIAVVVDLRTLHVETSDVDEFIVARVTTGEQVQVYVDALDNLALIGTVSNVALLPQSGSSSPAAYPVTIEVGGLPPEVRAGMSVRVTFSDSAAR